MLFIKPLVTFCRPELQRKTSLKKIEVYSQMQFHGSLKSRSVDNNEAVGGWMQIDCYLTVEVKVSR